MFSRLFFILRVINELIVQKGKDKNELRQLSSLLFIAIDLKEIHDFCDKSFVYRSLL